MDPWESRPPPLYSMPQQQQYQQHQQQQHQQPHNNNQFMLAPPPSMPLPPPRGPPPRSSPSKTALVLISSSPMGMIGIDRMYMHCTRSGWAKFFLSMLVVVFTGFLGPLATPVIIFYALWLFYDYMTVMLNALSMSYLRPFCDPSVQSEGWTSQRDVRWAFWLGLAVNIVFLANLILLVAFIIISGPDKILEYFRPYWESITKNVQGAWDAWNVSSSSTQAAE